MRVRFSTSFTFASRESVFPEYPLLDAYKTFLLNNTLNASLNHMTYMKMGSFHGFPLLPSWSKCQLAQLTPRGIAQHLQIGQILRTAYGLPLGLTQPDRSHYSNDASASGPNIPNTPTHGIENNIIVFSTRYRRTFQSAMALLYGLLPVDKWLGMNVRDSHSLTFCFSDCACPKGDQLKGTVNALLEKEQQQVKTLVKFMEERLLQSPGNNYHALGIRDALLTFLCHDRKVPCEKDAKSGGEGNAENKRAKSDAITSELDIINIDQDSNGIGIGVVEGLAQSSVGEDKSEADDANDDGNGDIISAFTDNGKCIQDQHIDQLMEFTDSLLLKIRHSPDMRLISLLRAYGFLRNAVNYMLKMISGSNIKMVLYSGHDLTIQYLLSAMGLNGKEFIDIPYATRLIFEVYRSENDGQFYFRVVYNGEDVTRQVMVCEGAKSLRFTRGGGGGGNARKASVVDLCPIENIIRYIHDDYFSPLNASNFKDACFAAKY